MIAQIGRRLKVEKSDRVRTTSFADLPLLTELAHRTELIADLNAIPGLWKRAGRYGSADYLMSLALTLTAGGEGLDDTRVLRRLPAGVKLRSVRTLMRASVAPSRTFLKRHGC